MCDISGEFILCTCAGKDLKDKNYWEMYRYDENRPYMIGLTNPHLDHERFQSTSDFILAELNSRNCFDKDVALNDDDVLVVVTQKENAAIEKVHLAFRFHLGKWEKRDYDMMLLSNKHVKKGRGSIS